MPRLSRRAMLAGAGALVVSVGARLPRSAFAQGKPELLPAELDSYVAVKADGAVTAFFGKMDVGHGLTTAIAQLVAEELDSPFESVTVLMGDTDTSVNQGGASGSTGISQGGRQMRAAAAEARRLLVQMAAAKLGVPPEQIVTEDGRCSAGSQNVSYGDLIGGRYFNAKLAWNGQEGNALYAPGTAKVKDAKDFKIVGKPLPRGDIAWKAFGTGDFITEIKRPGMLHGRILRPPVAGAVPQAVEESSVAQIPGVRVWRKADFIGLTAPKEWDAVKARRALKVTWSNPKPAFVAQDAIYNHIRATPPRRDQTDTASQTGDVDAVFAKAAHVITAEYEWPFQSHASMGGACAVAEFAADGQLHVWTGSQKPHALRGGLANTLGLAAKNIHVKWITGPGSYGRNDADDCALDAALLAQMSGKPVRVQYMRDEATGWDPKAPASVHTGRAALDEAGNVTAFDFRSKGFSLTDLASGADKPGDTLMGQLTGAVLNSTDAMGVPSPPYNFPNKRQSWAVIPPLLDRASPLRSAHMRDPGGPQIAFGSECFIDELAAAAKRDPIAFRLQVLTDQRAIDAIQRAASLFGWESRPAHAKGAGAPRGQGFAYADRGGTRIALCAEVAVDPVSGKVTPLRFAVAHDCGQIVNPRSLKTTVEGALLQGVSRALYEEVRFTPAAVTSIDWRTYPILEIEDGMVKVDIALIDRPGVAMTGAGEGATRPVAAALANAVFDATGIRIRRAPLSPLNFKAATA